MAHTYKGVDGWERGGVGGGGRWAARGGLYLLLDTDSGTVSLLSDRNKYNSQYR